MPRNATPTRNNILDAAEALILEQGFAGTALDQVVARAGITKGTFFYHFPTKAALAHALVTRYAENDAALLERHMSKAEAEWEDPLDQVIGFIRSFEFEMGSLMEPYPGCLFASYITQSGMFDEDTLKIARKAMRHFRVRLGAKLREVTAHKSPRVTVDMDSLADAMTVVFEGAFVLSKTYQDAAVVAEQLAHYRHYIELLFDRS